MRDLNGTGSQFDRATVTITVQSVNQHKPKFTVPSLTNATVRVPENAADESFLVLVLKAEDADAGQNGLVSYHIRAGEELVQVRSFIQLIHQLVHFFFLLTFWIGSKRAGNGRIQFGRQQRRTADADDAGSRISIQLRTPPGGQGSRHSNVLRNAAALDCHRRRCQR